MQAENYYNQCLDHDQNHRDCYRALAVLLVEEHRSEEGLRLLENWANRNPASSAPKVELARLYQEFGQRDSAREQLLEALSVNPYDSQASAALGQLDEEQGNQAQALVNYQRSLGQNSFQPELAARANSIRSAMGTNTVVPPDPSGTRAWSAAAARRCDNRPRLGRKPKRPPRSGCLQSFGVGTLRRAA